MKINVITVLNTINYGSALQTFATQSFFEELGHEAEFVDYWRPDQTCSNMILDIIKEKRTGLKKWLKKPANDALRIHSKIKGTKLFRSFLKKHINLTDKKYMSVDDLRKNLPLADIYATGSDQMWNSIWNQGIEESFFLEHAPQGKKRIAFATSIGKTEFDETEVEAVTSLIKKYDFITLREQSAVDLLCKYDIKSHLVLDPTLMFNGEFWRKHCIKTEKNKPYLLVYQLHLEHDNADFNAAVKHFAEERNLEICRIAYSKSDRKIGKKIVLPDIFEFLSLIDNAEFVVTDSFHGTAFSVNLNKQFACIYPGRFSTRMDNLLKITRLEDRHLTNDSDLNVFENDISYEPVNKILEQKRSEIRTLFETYFDSVENFTE